MSRCAVAQCGTDDLSVVTCQANMILACSPNQIKEERFFDVFVCSAPQ